MTNAEIEATLGRWGIFLTPSGDPILPWQTVPLSRPWPIEKFCTLDHAWLYWEEESFRRIREVRAVNRLMERHEQLSDQDKGEMNRWLNSPGRVMVADALLEEIVLSNGDPIEANDLEMLDCWIEKYGSVCDSWVLKCAREKWH